MLFYAIIIVGCWLWKLLTLLHNIYIIFSPRLTPVRWSKERPPPAREFWPTSSILSSARRPAAWQEDSPALWAPHLQSELEQQEPSRRQELTTVSISLSVSRGEFQQYSPRQKLRGGLEPRKERGTNFCWGEFNEPIPFTNLCCSKVTWFHGYMAARLLLWFYNVNSIWIPSISQCLIPYYLCLEVLTETISIWNQIVELQ